MWTKLLGDWMEKLQQKTSTPKTKESASTTPSVTPAESQELPKATSSKEIISPIPFTQPHKPKHNIATRRFNPKRIEVKPTPNRPQDVSAIERFTKWRPADTQNKDTKLSFRQEEQVRQVILSSLADSTKEGYSTAIAQWHNFCDRYGVEEGRRSPADPELVELWIAEAAGAKSGGYLSDWVSGLKSFHILNNVPWLADEARMKLIKRGARYQQPPPNPPRPPMTVDWLNKVLPHANFDDPKELAVAAAAACGVWGLFRLGELTMNDPVFDADKHISRDRVQTTFTDMDGKPILTMKVFLPRTKVQHHGEAVILTQQAPPSDPIGLITLHAARNPTLDPANTPLFAYRVNNTLVALNRTTFGSTITALTRRAKEEDMDGHSMRIGGCTSLLKRGMPLDRLMIHGRWGSDTWKRYVREHAEILAPFLVRDLQNARDDAQVQEQR
ncbi:hypothetical protein A4X13_0g8950 [Tilletia indica]|uniref:Tyr recombinase domain-containing protein n=1 Tax=Tilletia indica TaxID=43049 RepID=A0A177SYN3_9BASI|nr:hypothetical protein A4X13_0g8950 [Tilletia indica]